ncbi:MAG: tyrosine-type recombinase/integrase [Chitinophagales bacterium]|nr:tyrosine-type recombinase/integrase [Chitinophagales bacterium]
MIDNFLVYIQKEKRYSLKTVQAYKVDLQQFSEFLNAEFQLADINQAKHNQIRAWIISLINQEQKPTSLKRKVSALKSYYKFALKKSWIKTNPALKITTPKVAERLPKYIEEKNINHLLDGELDDTIKTNVTDDEFLLLRNKLIVDVFYATGIRREELINLSWNDILQSNITYQLKITGKGNKQRLIPISNTLYQELLAYQQAQTNYYNSTANYIFLTDKGSQMYPNFVYRLIKKYLSMCSTAEKKSPHVLRHSFATHMSNHGAKLNDIKELMGHASLASTQVYTHNTIEQLKEIYKIAHPKA